jgi:hypothetical protein
VEAAGVKVDAGIGSTTAAAGAGSGATAQPAGSAAAGAAAGAGSGAASAATTTGIEPLGSAEDAPLLSRLRNAVTSPPVETMLTTDHPSADFSVSLVANAAGSYDDELTVVNSCMRMDANAIVKVNRRACPIRFAAC